jgi:DNA-binding NtrC family response regulator
MRILVVDDEKQIREMLRETLSQDGYEVELAGNGPEALKIAQDKKIEIALVDIVMPGIDGLELTSRLRECHADMDVIIITAYSNRDFVVKALRARVYDFLVKPLNIEELLASVSRASEKHLLLQENKELRQKLVQKGIFYGLVGTSPVMQRLYGEIEKFAPSECNILITGESGTGKELTARAIHKNSHRSHRPLIVVDCAALKEELLESELFGHVKGSFTGALYDKTGIIEKANGGTLFLDEISSTSLSFQSKLLRIVQEREIKKVGSTQLTPVDIRIISATSQDPVKMVKDEILREDLFYRLNVARIDVAPLRQRKEDISLLVRFFIQGSRDLPSPDSFTITDEAMERLLQYDWPGNVRELENAIERAIAAGDKTSLLIKDLPEQTRGLTSEPPSSQSLLPLKEVEKRHILSVLENAGGHRAKTAQILGISERNLYRKLLIYDIDE